MASMTAIATVFSTLRGAGCLTSNAWLEEAEANIRLWSDLTPMVRDEEIVTAARAWVTSARSAKWPALGELLETLPEVRHRHGLVDLADTWFKRVQRLRMGHGPDKPPGKGWQLDADPIEAAAVEAGIEALGGWRALGSLSVDSEMADRASWRTAYKGALQRIEHEIEQTGHAQLAGPTLKLLPGGKS